MKRTATMLTAAAMAVAMAVPVQAFYTYDNRSVFAEEMRFMFGCMQRGGLLDSCKAQLERKRAEDTRRREEEARRREAQREAEARSRRAHELSEAQDRAAARGGWVDPCRTGGC